MYNEINPSLGDIEPSFLHIYSKKTDKSNLNETIFTLCVITTTPLVIKLHQGNSLIHQENLTPKILYNERLCVSGQLKFFHKSIIQITIYDSDKNELLKSSSDRSISLNHSKIDIKKSNEAYKQFYYRKNNSRHKISFFKIIFLKIKYIYIKSRRLVLLIVKTLFDIMKYIFTSKLR